MQEYNQAAEVLRNYAGINNPTDMIAALDQAGFNQDKYLASQLDLVAKGLDADLAFGHFVRFGVSERRSFPARLSVESAQAIRSAGADNPAFTQQLLAALASVTALDIPPPGASQFEAELHRVLALAEAGAAPYVILGDSHSKLYRRTPVVDGGWLMPIQILLSGGSAQGLSNLKSRSGYGLLIRSFLERMSQNERLRDLPILFLFGGVDIEFVYTFKRIQDNKIEYDRADAEEYCQRVVSSYLTFLREAAPAGLRSKVTILPILPPTLADEKWAEGYVNGHVLQLENAGSEQEMRKNVSLLRIPDLPERTRLHAYLNDLLKKGAADSDFAFAGPYSEFLGPDGVVDPGFIPSGKGSDHHLEFYPTAPVIEPFLITALGRSAVQPRPA